MIPRLYYILICSTCIFAMGAPCQVLGQSNLAQTNLQYLYNPVAPLSFESQVAMSDTEATVFLHIRNSQQGQSLSVNYQVKENYQDENIINQGEVGIQQLIGQQDNHLYYKFVVPVTEASRYLFVFTQLNINNTPVSFRYDIPLQGENTFPATDLIMMRPDEDIPIFSNYLDSAKAFRIASIYRQSTEAYMYYYSYDFTPNPPPMAVRGAEASETMSIDSLFSVPVNDSLSFGQKGLYFIQTDTTSLSGISFRITDQYFPRLVAVDQVIAPLRYISTSEEMEELETSQDKKEALDRYLMKITRSQKKAKALMRSYFRNVTEANRLFTTYKEGWKTGQGMVYVLYGTPNQVFRDNDREVWVYNADQDLTDLTFTFAKVKNIYTNQHYNLIPDEDYKKFWFRNIDLWRKGMKSLQ